jgi:transcriptional regulator GlxA family with amidase domain
LQDESYEEKKSYITFIKHILIDEKNIITVGGINAYLDLCLYIIEKFHSCKTATQLANLMLIDRGRGSQKSYKSFSTILLFDDEDIKNSILYMKDNLHKQLSILDLANKLNLTEKTYSRRFKKSINIFFTSVIL